MKKVRWIIITETHELSTYKDSWDELVSKCGVDKFFNSFTWISSWINFYWQADWKMSVYLAYYDDELVAILPFYTQQQPEHFFGPKPTYPLGQGEKEFEEVCSEYQDLLISPDWFETLSHDIVRILSGSFDKIICKSIKSGSWLHKLTPFISHHISDSKRYFIIKDDWDIEATSRNFKSHYNRSNNKLKKLNHEFKWVERAEQKNTFEVLSHLHKQRWKLKGKDGAFGSKKFQDFHHFLTNTTENVKLSALTVEGEVIAVNYYFTCENILYFYQSGWNDIGLTSFSPGLLLHCWSIEHSEEIIYDFMRGGEKTYKKKYHPMSDLLHDVTLHLSYASHFSQKLRDTKKFIRTLRT